MKVNDFLQDECPETRMDQLGLDSLTDAELLSVLTRSKTPQGIEQMRKVLHDNEGLAGLYNKPWQMIGTTAVRSRVIEAAMELGRRADRYSKSSGKMKFTTPEDVNQYFGPKLRHLENEHFVLLCLNAAKHMIGEYIISKGGKTAAIVDVSSVLRKAIMTGAVSFVVIHNHPSMNRRASRADIALTKKLSQAGETMDIKMDDHLIIAGYDYLSMRMEGLI